MAAPALHSGTIDPFDTLAQAVRNRLERTIAAHGPHLFTTGAAGLNTAYLDGFAGPEDRQHHNCSCCRRFLEGFGGLVAICADGTPVSALWDPETAPPRYRASVAALARAVAGAPITGVFLDHAETLGTPDVGGWTHFAVTTPPGARVRGRALTAWQVMAAKREDFRTLSHGLAEFGRDAVAQALTLLEADALYRSEKVIGPARFLLELHDARAKVRGPARENFVWRAVAAAPVGFCTPRSSMIGTLLEDIVAGLPFEDVKRRFAAKMHPLQYQRPQAAPSAGTIAQAERLFAQMDLAPALERRFARIEDCELIWSPAPDAPPAVSGGVFSHLTPKNEPAAIASLEMTPQEITWVKFARTVLPNARRMEVRMTGRMNLCTLVTAVRSDAPPLLQWDREDRRNPVSWYVYPGGETAEEVGLRSGSWAPVTGVTLQPSMWGDPEAFTRHGRSAIFLLKGACDTRRGGLGLFPETMRSDLHSVRSVIEAHSRSRQLEGREEASACGLRVGDTKLPHAIRVTTATGTAVYRIDRWD